MANVDGDITLGVKIEPQNIQKTAEGIQTELEGIFNKTSKKDLGAGFDNARASAARLYVQLQSVRDKMTEMEALRTAYTTDKAGNVVPTQAYQDLANKLNLITNSASLAKRHLEDLATSGGLRPDISQYDILRERIRGVVENVKTLITNFQTTIQSCLGVKNAFAGIANVTIDLTKKFAELAKRMGSSMIKTAGNALKNLGSAMSGLNHHTRSSNGLLEIGFKKLVQYGFGIRTVFLLVKKLRQALIDGFSSMAQYSGEFNNVVSQFVSALATLKLAFATAFAPIASVAIPLLTGLMNALIDAMNLMGKFFAALTGKSNFIQAKRVQKDYAASLNDTGKSGGSAAKGIKKAEKAAKEAQKTIAGFDDVEILHDNSDTSPSAGSGGSGGGGGGGGVGDLSGADMFETVPIESKIRDFANKIRDLIGAQDWTGLGTFLGECINSIFATAKDLISWDNVGTKIEFFVNAITTTFNALVDAIDWDLIGSTFGEGVNTIVNTLYLFVTKIDWGNLGKKLMQGLNSFISTVNWSKLGKLFAEGVNAVFKFLYSAITEFKWGQAATKLLEMLSSFIRTVDWARVGRTISEFFKGVLTFLFTVLNNFDWAGLAKAIGDFLSGIDWLGIINLVISGIATFLGQAMGTIFSLIGGVCTSIAEYVKTEGLVGLLEAGGNIIAGVLTGIVNAVANIGTWIVDNIFKPFIDGFKSAFGIASPSKVMEEQGGFIIEGLLNGITNAWTSIKTFFSEGVTGIIDKIKKGKWSSAGEESINQTKKGITKKWSEVPKFFTTGVNDVISKFKNSDWKGTGETSVDKTKSGISNKWSGISNYFATGTSNIISKFKNSEWKGTGETSVNKTKEGVSNKWSVLSKYFDTNVTAINTAIKNAKWGDAGKAIVTTLKAGIANTWSVISAYIKDKTTTISNYIKHFDWASAGRKIVSELKSGLSSTWGTVNDFISSKIGGIKDKFYSTNWSGIGEDICSGISRGMSNGWSWVTSKAKDLAEAAYDAARNKLDIHSPSKLFRDGIGKMIPEGLALGISQNEDLALNAMKRLTSSIGSTEMPKLEIPSIAMGKIIPYQAGKTTNSDNTTLAEVANLLKYNQQHSVSKDDLAETLRAVLPSMLREYMSFYIGDEQIARHANAGNVSLNRRFSTTG